LTTQDVNTFFKRHTKEFGVSSNLPMTGGQGGVAYGIEGEKNPGAFITVWKVALDGKFKDGELVAGTLLPANKPVVIKREALDLTLSKRVRAGRPDAGSAIFALQPVKVAGDDVEVIPSVVTKSRKRRKRRNRSRG